jgi:2-octaprenylphenol hydroxylase
LPTGPLALLPLPDAQHSALVWTLPQAQVESTLALSNAEFCLSLETASEASVGAILDCTPRQAFPLRAQQAARYCGLRLALVGDAAHVIHPLAGQGVNLGLLDVAALVEAITAQRDPGSLLALRHYERLRRADNTQMLMAMSALNTVFSLEQPWLGALRRQGIQAINSLALVKRPLMLAAAGLRPPPLALTRLSWTL